MPTVRCSRLGMLDTQGAAILRIPGRARESDHVRERFWSIQSGKFNPKGYLLLLASTDGRIHRALTHEPAWWSSLPANARGEITGPSSRVMDVRQRNDGLLMVLISQPKDNWRRLPQPARGFTGLSFPRLLLIDPDKGELRRVRLIPPQAQDGSPPLRFRTTVAPTSAVTDQLTDMQPQRSTQHSRTWARINKCERHPWIRGSDDPAISRQHCHDSSVTAGVGKSMDRARIDSDGSSRSPQRGWSLRKSCLNPLVGGK